MIEGLMNMNTNIIHVFKFSSKTNCQDKPNRKGAQQSLHDQYGYVILA